MNNVMLDLETWGTRPGCAIRSIGAVVFDPISGEMGTEFYANIEDNSCTGAGLVKDENTIKWWADRGPLVQDILLLDQRPLKMVLEDFIKWFRKSQGIFVWSQGANFDEPIVETAMHAVGMETPWRYYNVRDTRTMYDLAKFDPQSIKRDGTHHSALDDAKFQAKCVQESYCRLYNGRRA